MSEMRMNWWAREIWSHPVRLRTDQN